VLKPGDTIGLMEGVRGVPALDARIKGVQDALADTGVTVILGGAETKCDSAQGATVAQDLLTREPNLTAIYSACDDPALAAADVAAQKGKQLLVMGYDGLPEAAEAILAGSLRATIAQFPGRMADLGVRAAVDAVHGEPVESFIDTGTELVTTDNAEEFRTFR
jgi:simple sugar transport system substrate-binding protein